MADFDSERAAVQRLIRDASAAASSLQRSQPRSPLGAFGGLVPLMPEAVRGAASVHLERRLRTAGPPPAEVPAHGKCLQALLKTTDTMYGHGATTVLPYDPARVQLVAEDHIAIDVEAQADASLLSLLQHPDKFLFADDRDDCLADVEQN